MNSSCEKSEHSTLQLKSLLQLVATQLTLSSSQEGESMRRRSRSRRAQPGLTRRRSEHSSCIAEHKNKKEKHVVRSQSLVGQEGQEQVCFESNTDIDSIKTKKKKVRSKSTAFELRHVIRLRVDRFHPESGGESQKQADLNPKQKPGKTLRRIQTFLRKPRKWQSDSVSNLTNSSSYCKETFTEPR